MAQPLIASVRTLHRRLTGRPGRGGEASYTPQESAELCALLGSLELLDVPQKIELGGMVLDLMSKPKQKPARIALAWTLGRLGARVPVYGPLNRIVPPEVAWQWLEALMRQRPVDPTDPLAAMQLARRTGDRYRDVSEKAAAGSSCLAGGPPGAAALRGAGPGRRPAGPGRSGPGVRRGVAGGPADRVRAIKRGGSPFPAQIRQARQVVLRGFTPCNMGLEQCAEWHREQPRGCHPGHFSGLGTLPVLNPQTRNAAELRHVMGDENQSNRQRARRDHQVVRTDRNTSHLEVCSYAAVHLRRGIIEGQ